MKHCSVLLLTATALLLSACIVPYHDGGRGNGHGHYKNKGYHGHPGNIAYGHSQGKGPHR